MVAISISVEGWFGLTWADWKRLVAEVEQLGFAGLFLSDHFNWHEPPALPSLELIVALTYLADHTRRVPFGPMVSPLSLRDPVMLARQAAALDDLSDGRMILGVGAGWYESEHRMFGYDLGDVATRMARFEEGLEVITRLLRGTGPVSFDGRFFRLRDAMLPPTVARPGGPPILIGGGGPRRTLPLVARYADIWNATWMTPDVAQERSSHLDELLRAAGRQPGDVRRTMILPVFCGRDAAEIDDRIRGLRRFSRYAAMSIEEIRTELTAIIGTPKEVIDQVRSFGRVGIEELCVQWFAADDIAGLRLLAEQVLPGVAA